MNPPGLSFIGVLPPLPGAEPGVVGLLPGLLLFGDKGPKTYNIPEQDKYKTENIYRKEMFQQLFYRFSHYLETEHCVNYRFGGKFCV